MYNEKLLSELLRPTVLEDIVGLPDRTLNALKYMVATNSPMNMIFYGKAGTGKTSTARILMNELDLDVLEINGSEPAGISGSITGFTTTMSLFGKQKLLFIEEADYLHLDVQAKLRYPIENSSLNIRYIFTANDIMRFHSAIKSRCMPVCFDVPVENIVSTIDKMVQRYSIKLDQLGYVVDAKKIRNLICSYFPDFRAIANHFQFELELKDQQMLSA